MKKLILLLTFLALPNFVYSQINEDEFFNISNFTLKIHRIDKGEYLFYGYNGGMVRTYDSGVTWVQNYAGTKNNILQLVNHKDYVVGITNQNEFMTSHDKGSHWFVNKLKDSIVSIDANDDLIVLATERENLLLSSDLGKNWNNIKASDFSIKSIKIVNSRMFILDQYNRLYYSDDTGANWNKVDLPEEINDNTLIAMKRDGNNLSVRSGNSIFSILENLELVKYTLEASKIDQYFVTDINIIHANGSSFSREFNLNSYSKLNNSETEISKMKNHYFEGNALQVVDLIVDENLILMTCPNKTILKSKDNGVSWIIESYMPLLSANYFKFWDKNDWSIISNSGVILNSINGGATYKPGNDIILDTTGTPPIHSYFYSFNYFSKDSAIYFLLHDNSNTKTKDIYTTNDGGRTLIEYPNKFLGDPEYIINFGDDLYFNRDLSYGGRYGRTRAYYKLSDGFKVDSLNSLDSMNSNFHKVVIYEDKIYIFRSLLTEGSSNVSIEYSDDKFKTIKNIHTFNNSEIDIVQHIYKSRNENLYFSGAFSNTYFRLDTKTNEVFEINKPFALLSTYRETEFIEDQKYFTTNEFRIKDTTYHRKYVEVSFDGVDMVFDTIGHNTFGLIPTKFIHSEGLVLLGDAQNIWKKIDSDRLTTSVSESEIEILPVWPLTPTPNPAKSNVNIKFYTEKSDIINEMKVKLVNISSGVEYNIKDYNLTLIDKWNGEISFDISQYMTGSYIIELTLEDYSRSTKLIITK